MHDYGWMWLIIDVVLVAALAAGLVYGVAMWRHHYRDRATQRLRDEATRRLYQEER